MCYMEERAIREYVISTNILICEPSLKQGFKKNLEKIIKIKLLK